MLRYITDLYYILGISYSARIFPSGCFRKTYFLHVGGSELDKAK